jgi:hypothetical protein
MYGNAYAIKKLDVERFNLKQLNEQTPNVVLSTTTVISEEDSTSAVVSSGSMVSDYGLDTWAIGVRSPAEAKDFSSILCVQISSGANPASCTMGTGDPFPGGKSAAGV